jgi:endogenous inhibitor of DNA gyrase (YacG/DUF329 family)
MEINNQYQRKIIKLKDKKIKCPTCKKKSKEPFTPFCSKKCSDLDLMYWLSDGEINNYNSN